MKFTELPYVRPDRDASLAALDRFTAQLAAATNKDDAHAALKGATDLLIDLHSMASLCHVRHSIDTRDAFYEAARDFFDEFMPAMQESLQRYHLALLNAPQRPYLESVLGKHAFDVMALSIKTISPDVLPDLIAENKLESTYDRLIASAKLDFDGKELTLAQMGPYLEAADRDVRKRASDVYFGFFAGHEAQMDEIYDEMVQLRTKIARTLGYENFIELGYARMGRTDYDHVMVKTYRDQVHRVIVPIAAKLREAQRERLEVATLFYHDEAISDPKGNPTPIGDVDKLMNDASIMFKELSPETDTFFTFMKEAGSMDLLAKPGKQGGGYCTSFMKWKMPFIFANFNGTKGDVEVFTHEGGHAYNVFASRDDEWGLYHEYGMETAEVHSMSMEFLTWPWMERFFGDAAARFRYYHLADALLFIPYGVAVDHFQELVYANPDATPDERKQFWKDVEARYLPWRQYEENDFLDRGNVWKRQSHIFGAPFYYIDYTLAQVMAFWFWNEAQKDPAAAWQRYDAFTRNSGTAAFQTLLIQHEMPNPFQEGSLDQFIPAVAAYLATVDPLTC